jgi:hypothetical protein
MKQKNTTVRTSSLLVVERRSSAMMKFNFRQRGTLRVLPAWNLVRTSSPALHWFGGR